MSPRQRELPGSTLCRYRGRFSPKFLVVMTIVPIGILVFGIVANVGAVALALCALLLLSISLWFGPLRPERSQWAATGSRVRT